MQKYLEAIRKNVCSICVDSTDEGDCTLTEKEVCAVESFLPRIVDVIHNAQEDDLQTYINELREKVCAECRSNGDENCYLREDANCALDRYFPLIIDAIKSVDGDQHAH